MAYFLLDSSAVVKRYLSEVGTAWVTGLLSPAVGNRIHIAAIAGVEVVSAITRRQRGGTVSVADAVIALTAFRQDFSQHYGVIDVSPVLIVVAMRLAETHALRGYDAVQLAAALEVSTLATAVGEPFTFVSADTALLAAAVLEGLAVENPNAHP